MRTSTQISVAEAARQTGKNKSTITRKIESGRISAFKDENGQWWIEPVELFRSIPPLPTDASASAQNASDAASCIDAETFANALESDAKGAPLSDAHRRTIDALRRELEMTHRENQLRQEERERERRQQQERIDDLVHRLDASETERRQTTTQLTALLRDDRDKLQEKQQEPPAAPKGWLRRLVSG